VTSQSSTMAARLEDIGDASSTARHSGLQQSTTKLNTHDSHVSCCRSVISQVDKSGQISHARNTRFVAVLVSGLQAAANRVLEIELTAVGFTISLSVTCCDLL